MCANLLAGRSNMQFQPGNLPFAQRPLPPCLQRQRTPIHFSCPLSIIQQLSPAVQFHHPPVQNPLPVVQQPPPPNFAGGPRQFSVDEQWRMGLIDLNSDHRGVWMRGVRSCSGPAYAQDVYPTPPPEKPCIGTANFQPLLLNRYPGCTSGPGCANDMIPAGQFCLH